MNFVLSLFPGIGLLDHAFEEEGFCVVRGPDVLWGGDIHKFHPPAGKFDGVIGGPPCQAFSELAKLVRHNGHQPKFGNLIPEFYRVVLEANPLWFVMENVPKAPDPDEAYPDDYTYLINSAIYRDCDYGGETVRRRKIWFGKRHRKGIRDLRVDRRMRESLLPPERAVTGDCRSHSSGQRIRNKEKSEPVLGVGKSTPLSEMCELQGLPKNFLEHSPFTSQAKRQMVGNGVPLALGRAIARAVKEATAPREILETVP